MLMLCLCHLYAMYICYAYVMLILFLCHVYVIFMLCLCYVYVMLMLCLCYVYIMFISCSCFVYFMFMLCCQAQFKSSSSSVQLRTETGLIITVTPPHPTHPPTHPTRTSIFEPLLDHLGGWNLVWKLYSTKLGQLAN